MISVRPSRGGPYFAGTALNLTCDIELDPAIDLPVIEEVRWSFVGGMTIGALRASERVTFTETSIEFFPVDIVDSGTFGCHVKFTTEIFFHISPTIELSVQGIVTNYICSRQLSYLWLLCRLDLPDYEFDIIGPLNVTAGDFITVDCSVPPVPHLVTPPRLELVGPNNTVLVNTTEYNISETLGPILVSQAGQQYFCRAVQEIESIGFSHTSLSTNTYTITVQGKSSLIHCPPHTPHSLAQCTVDFLALESCTIHACIYLWCMLGLRSLPLLLA